MFLINPYVHAAGTLPLTDAFITATSIVDTTIINALNTFEGELISGSLTSDLLAVYPFVGGDATKHQYNFMDTTNYNLTFAGGITHSSTGALFNGTTGYANTNINPTTVGLDLNSMSMGAYSRTQSVRNTAFFGAYSGPTAISYFPNYSSNQLYSAMNGDESYTLPYTNTSSQGLFTVNRVLSTEKQDWINGTKVQTLTGAQRGATTKSLVNESLTLSAVNSSGSRYYHSNRELCFAFVGSVGLTDAKVQALYTAVQNLQTSLSRQV